MEILRRILCAMLAFTCSAFAEDVEHSSVTSKSSVWAYAKQQVADTWHAADYELYIPINTWHNRNAYTVEQIDRFNEQPWGIGAGKYRYDEDGDWQGIYIMAFLDSQSKIEPIVGYGFQKVWHATNNLKLGIGYTVGVTFRDDYDYLPLPVLLPLLSVKYKEIALQTTYIPGGEGHGNVLFTWLRWELH